MMAIGAATEQETFQAVIDAFHELYPNVTVKYTSGGDNLAPLLSTAVQGGNPPDIACIAQPGLMADFVDQGALQSIDDLRGDIVDNFGEAVADVGSIDGKQYAVSGRPRTSRPSGTTSPTSTRQASTHPRHGTSSTVPPPP